MGIGRLLKNCRWFLLAIAGILMWGFLIFTGISLVMEARAEEGDGAMPEEEYYDSLELLALCVEAEAGNQSIEGKRMAADVILNRMDSPDRPDIIEGVIADPYEFASFWNGAIDSTEPSEETFRVVLLELESRSYPGLYYFTANGYPEYGTPWKKVGDHYFSGK